MKFRDPNTNSLYTYRTMECNWNKTWTPVATLDNCVFYQCANPPSVSNIYILYWTWKMLEGNFVTCKCWFFKIEANSLPFIFRPFKYVFMFLILQPPPETGLKSDWNRQPVPFFSNSSYSCANASTFFANNRSQLNWNITCLPGGVWNTPTTWPACITSRIIKANNLINFLKISLI